MTGYEAWLLGMSFYVLAGVGIILRLRWEKHRRQANDRL